MAKLNSKCTWGEVVLLTPWSDVKDALVAMHAGVDMEGMERLHRLCQSPDVIHSRDPNPARSLVIIGKDEFACHRTGLHLWWSLQGEDPWTLTNMDITLAVAAFPQMTAAEFVARILCEIVHYGYPQTVHDALPHLPPPRPHQTTRIKIVTQKELDGIVKRGESTCDGRPRRHSVE